jgi:hypothetical protein
MHSSADSRTSTSELFCIRDNGLEGPLDQGIKPVEVAMERGYREISSGSTGLLREAEFFLWRSLSVFDVQTAGILAETGHILPGRLTHRRRQVPKPEHEE